MAVEFLDGLAVGAAGMGLLAEEELPDFGGFAEQADEAIGEGVVEALGDGDIERGLVAEGAIGIDRLIDAG
ncbi:MAG TPA: hypothetical protein VME43_00120 [Bryobacteraceae bacterium]|nr:hypothetical protein [Bryobacteraceae bacterium]